jgi:ectoine hydroxylase-related dioxygenase (phytanoyl-CoA dioxygenase family)
MMRVGLPPDLDTRFAQAGIAIIEYALTAADLTEMDRAFPVLPPGAAGARAADFAADDFGWLAEHTVLAALAERLGGEPLHLVRALALDKSPSANWFVPWHQDRADDHTERPADVLARIVTLRVHLDDCGEDNGPLEVLPGTHLAGRLARTDVARLTQAAEPLLCLAARGDILAMRPLLLHRSQRARKPAARRVLHLEWAPAGQRTM